MRRREGISCEASQNRKWKHLILGLFGLWSLVLIGVAWCILARSKASVCSMSQKINIDKPRYDQSTFEGRAKYFFSTTNPLNVLASDEELDRAKMIVEDIRAGIDHPELTHDDIWRAKELYDSAFHPQTGEKLFIMGRMSFQVPGNMSITGCMLTFYKSTPAVIFWQFANQTFNTIVNYSNRNGE